MRPLWTQTLHTSVSYHLTMRQKDMWTESVLPPLSYIYIVIAYSVKKGILYFSSVIEDGLLGNYLFITLQKSKLKNFH